MAVHSGSIAAPDAGAYQLLVESVTDYAIFLLDAEGCIRSWNAGAQRIKGYAADEVIGRHFSLFYPAERIEQRWPEYELRIARDEGRFEDEGWRVRKDGTRFWANVVITRLTGPDGALQGFAKITRDLTARHSSEELLRQSEERFRLMVESVQDYAIFMLDPQGRVVSWNAGAEKTKGYTAAEIVGRHFSLFYPPDVAASGWPQQLLEFALRDGRFEDEGWRVRKDGSRFWANVVITALFDSSGRHRGYAKVTRDMTSFRRISELEDEGRRMTRFLAMLGHELRNPIAPLANAAALLQHEPLDSPQLRLVRDVLARQTRQLARLVNDLLDVGRVTSGKIRLAREPVEARQVLLQAVEAVQPLADERGHRLHVDAGESPAWVRGDHARLVQVFTNLLDNAVKYTPAPGGVIRASLRCADEWIEVAVQDNGPGIAQADLPRLFGLFEQGAQDGVPASGGLGLGLSIVRQLVSMHGGEISAYSRGDRGRGSEFVVRLPRIAAPARSAPLPPPIQVVADAPVRRLLVVDDNRDAADTLQAVLQAWGYACEVCYDGRSADAAIRRSRPDAVFLDIALPDVSGRELAARLRAELDDPPCFVALSGYGQHSDRQASFQAGFVEHAVKPLSEADLRDLLARVFAPPPRARLRGADASRV